MNNPQRIALTAALAAAAIPAAMAIALASQDPLNRLLWQLSYRLPAEVMAPMAFLVAGLGLACFSALIGFAIAKIWRKRP